MGIPVGEGAPVNRQDVSVDTSYAMGGTVATRRHRRLRPEEVVEIMGVILLYCPLARVFLTAYPRSPRP